MSCTIRTRHARGFTLLEVLIAVTLLALLLTVAYGSLRTAVHVGRSSEALIARTEQTRTAQAFLRRQFSQAMPLAYERLEDGAVERRFEGSDDNVRFVAPMPGYLSRGGPHVQNLAIVDDGRGQRLEFTHAQLNGYDPDEPLSEGRDPVVLLDGFVNGRFEYRALDENGELGDWEEEWDDDAQRLPLMVRLHVEFEDGNRRTWPELEVSVLASSLPAFAFGRARGMPRPQAQPEQPDFGPSRPGGG